LAIRNIGVDVVVYRAFDIAIGITAHLRLMIIVDVVQIRRLV
jgi:hypothetical protein